MLKYSKMIAFYAYLRNRGMFFRKYGIKSPVEGVNGD